MYKSGDEKSPPSVFNSSGGFKEQRLCLYKWVLQLGLVSDERGLKDGTTFLLLFGWYYFLEIGKLKWNVVRNFITVIKIIQRRTGF